LTSVVHSLQNSLSNYRSSANSLSSKPITFFSINEKNPPNQSRCSSPDSPLPCSLLPLLQLRLRPSLRMSPAPSTAVPQLSPTAHTAPAPAPLLLPPQSSPQLDLPSQLWPHPPSQSSTPTPARSPSSSHQPRSQSPSLPHP